MDTSCRCENIVGFQTVKDKKLTSIMASRCPRQSLGPLLKGMKACASSLWSIPVLCLAKLSSGDRVEDWIVVGAILVAALSCSCTCNHDLPQTARTL